MNTLCLTQCDSRLRNPGFSPDIHAFLIMKKRPRLHSAGTHPNFIIMRQQGELWSLPSMGSDTNAGYLPALHIVTGFLDIVLAPIYTPGFGCLKCGTRYPLDNSLSDG